MTERLGAVDIDISFRSCDVSMLASIHDGHTSSIAIWLRHPSTGHKLINASTYKYALTYSDIMRRLGVKSETKLGRLGNSIPVLPCGQSHSLDRGLDGARPRNGSVIIENTNHKF